MKSSSNNISHRWERSVMSALYIKAVCFTKCCRNLCHTIYAAFRECHTDVAFSSWLFLELFFLNFKYILPGFSGEPDIYLATINIVRRRKKQCRKQEQKWCQKKTPNISIIIINVNSFNAIIKRWGLIMGSATYIIEWLQKYSILMI